MSKVLYPIAWAWRFPDGTLGMWAEPDLPNLLRKNVPGPDCEPVRVRLVPLREFAAMKRRAK